MATDEEGDTRSAEYSQRLERLEGAHWKRWLDVQAPYRWNLSRLDMGFTLDVGCGIGRNLVNLGRRGVGIDHNPESVVRARERGCQAFQPLEFEASEFATEGAFDSLLVAHVLEHMRLPEAQALVERYLRYVRSRGRVVLITPQEAGYRSDSTHVEFLDGEALVGILDAAGLEVERSYSFPFPRAVGRFFVHNEFVAVARRC